MEKTPVLLIKKLLILVLQNLNLIYKDFCAKYDSLLNSYQYNNTLVGQAILGPYSPGSMVLGANQFDYRGNVFN